MSIQATFAVMGLRAKKSLVHHILVENAYENNVVSDISKVAYLQGHRGRTKLQPLPGLLAAPDPGIFERGGSPLAVIYSITNFLFSNEIM